MHHVKRGRKGVIGLLVAIVTGLTAVAVTHANASAPKRNIALILDYRVAYTCPVYPNYPKAGVIANQPWAITPTDIVAWRYNVNDTWAMISDKKYRNTSHAWWGFTPRVCIAGSVGGEHFPTPTSSYPAGVPIPSKILQGRSAVTASHYRSVNFTPSPGHVVNASKRINSRGTLRDARGRFVIGNVFAGWHVHQTNVHDGPWTLVYVPNAMRWGWVEDIHF
ncbi:MAG: hypothetical protein DLM57_05465 [Pseudonocardiales bacterium]|nr:MAG: hypothetical protein DLM57_05465 [Pseudonocardiales bacterium]